MPLGGAVVVRTAQPPILGNWWRSARPLANERSVSFPPPSPAAQKWQLGPLAARGISKTLGVRRGAGGDVIPGSAGREQPRVTSERKRARPLRPSHPREAMDPRDAGLLRAEVERLSAELQETTQEKVQAAQYGLAVLEENADLKQKYTDLESEHEAMKLELQQVKEALSESQINHKRVAADRERSEENLLKENSVKEAKLQEKVEDLQNELKQMRSFVTNTAAENEGLSSALQELKKECKSLETDKAQLRAEIKQCKIREMRQMQDCAELEEENVSLLKQVSVLKESQVEFEGVKHELKQRDEEIELLNGQVAELVRLREISEHQLEEALETLKSEREQKNELRRELSGFLNAYDSLGNFQVNLDELNEDELDSGYNNGGFGRLNGDFCMSTPRNSDIYQPAPSLACDLFSELSVTEIQKLKQQLMQVDREKSSLVNSMQELQRQLDITKEALSEQKVQNIQLTDEVRALKKIQERSPMRMCGMDDAGTQKGTGQSGDKYDDVEIAQLTKELHELRQKYQDFEAKYNDEKKEWEADSQELAEKIKFYIKSGRSDQEILTELEDELRASRKLALDFQGKLVMAQEELMFFTEELANLYHHICMCNNLTPNRVMLDYYKEGRGSKLQIRKRKSSDIFGKLLLNAEPEVLDTSGSGDQSPMGSQSSPLGSECGDYAKEPMNLTHLVAIVKDQIRHLQGALALSWHHTSAGSLASELEKDKEALVEEIMKLKSLLSTKREQIATLRTVLKANKQTAEVALANLKGKYENEKSLISETMLKLRHELKALKEDAATFSSLRAVFASRCDQYVSQLDEMQRQLAAAEDEKKTLNSLLRMAIQQKLALTERLESLGTPNDESSKSRLKLASKSKVRPSKPN
ncbi:protein bicaudal D homolog 2-like isoform X1 [Pleurodeles waltl]